MFRPILGQSVVSDRSSMTPPWNTVHLSPMLVAVLMVSLSPIAARDSRTWTSFLMVAPSDASPHATPLTTSSRPVLTSSSSSQPRVGILYPPSRHGRAKMTPPAKLQTPPLLRSISLHQTIALASPTTKLPIATRARLPESQISTRQLDSSRSRRRRSSWSTPVLQQAHSLTVSQRPTSTSPVRAKASFSRTASLHR